MLRLIVASRFNNESFTVVMLRMLGNMGLSSRVSWSLEYARKLSLKFTSLKDTCVGNRTAGTKSLSELEIRQAEEIYQRAVLEGGLGRDESVACNFQTQ